MHFVPFPKPGFLSQGKKTGGYPYASKRGLDALRPAETEMK